MSAAAAASAFEPATRARVATATLPASSGSREAMTTEWPPRTNDVARARPTLPAPMMAMSIGDAILPWLDELALVNQTLL